MRQLTERNGGKPFELGRRVHLIRDALRQGQVPLHHRPVPIAPVGTEHIEPLVTVDRDRVGGFDSINEVTCRGAHRGEQPERAIDMQPGSVFPREARHVAHRIEVTRVDIARRGDQDRGLAAQRLQRDLQSDKVDATGGIFGHELWLLAANPQHAERLDRARVQIAAGEDRHRWKPGETAIVNVQAVLHSPPAPCHRETGEVRHRRAGCDDRAPVARQAEQLFQPVGADLFEPCPQRRADPVVGVLVERRGEPVGAECGGSAAPHHEMEKARAGRPGCAVPRDRHQLGQRLQRTHTRNWKLRVERPLAQRTYERLIDLPQITLRLALDQAQRAGHLMPVVKRVRHRANLLASVTGG